MNCGFKAFNYRRSGLTVAGREFLTKNYQSTDRQWLFSWSTLTAFCRTILKVFLWRSLVRDLNVKMRSKLLFHWILSEVNKCHTYLDNHICVKDIFSVSGTGKFRLILVLLISRDVLLIGMIMCAWLYNTMVQNFYYWCEKFLAFKKFTWHAADRLDNSFPTTQYQAIMMSWHNWSQGQVWSLLIGQDLIKMLCTTI